MAVASVELSKIRDVVTAALDAVQRAASVCGPELDALTQTAGGVDKFLDPAVAPAVASDITREQAVAGIEAMKKLGTIAANDLAALNWLRNR